MTQNLIRIVNRKDWKSIMDLSSINTKRNWCEKRPTIRKRKF
jgi:hypothetical protein